MNFGLLGLAALDRYFVKMHAICGGFPLIFVQAYCFHACHCNGKCEMPELRME